LRFKDGSLDFLFVSHVLEHIEDDRLALSEMYRALSPGGVAFVEVPVLASLTYEDWSLKTQAERLIAFGQIDHVRLCGLDYVERLTRTGFDIEPLWIEREFSAQEIERMRLCAEELPDAQQQSPRRERLHHVSWLCRKPAAAQ
jgi:ubiquinone/menaquinone biosynthesis C-methylase UbiE